MSTGVLRKGKRKTKKKKKKKNRDPIVGANTSRRVSESSRQGALKMARNGRHRIDDKPHSRRNVEKILNKKRNARGSIGSRGEKKRATEEPRCICRVTLNRCSLGNGERANGTS